jgi:hypothetical protein
MSWIKAAMLTGAVLERMSGRRRRARSVEAQMSPLETKEILDGLAVEEDDPTYKAVRHVIHARSLQLAGLAGAPGMAAEESKALAMSAACVEDVNDEIEDIAKRALAARRGAAQEDLEPE